MEPPKTFVTIRITKYTTMQECDKADYKNHYYEILEEWKKNGHLSTINEIIPFLVCYNKEKSQGQSYMSLEKLYEIYVTVQGPYTYPKFLLFLALIETTGHEFIGEMDNSDWFKQLWEQYCPQHSLLETARSINRNMFRGSDNADWKMECYCLARDIVIESTFFRVTDPKFPYRLAVLKEDGDKVVENFGVYGHVVRDALLAKFKTFFPNLTSLESDIGGLRESYECLDQCKQEAEQAIGSGGLQGALQRMKERQKALDISSRAGADGELHHCLYAFNIAYNDLISSIEHQLRT